MVTSGLHARPVFQGRKLLKLRDLSIRVSPELTWSVVADDGKSITGELDHALATVDGVNMPIEELCDKQDGARQLVHDDEREAVQGVAEPNSQQHLRRVVQQVTGSVAERGQFLVRGDKVLPSFGQGTPTDNIFPAPASNTTFVGDFAFALRPTEADTV